MNPTATGSRNDGIVSLNQPCTISQTSISPHRVTFSDTSGSRPAYEPRAKRAGSPKIVVSCGSSLSGIPSNESNTTNCRPTWAAAMLSFAVLPPLKHPASTMHPARSSGIAKISRRIWTISWCVCAHEMLVWAATRRLASTPRAR